MKKYIVGLSAALLLLSGCGNQTEIDTATAVEQMSGREAQHRYWLLVFSATVSKNSVDS